MYQQLADLFREPGRFAIEAAVGHPDRPVTRDQQLRVASAVALECRAVPMVFPAVELDNQLRFRPEGVDLVSENIGILNGRGQAVLADEGGKADLQR